MADEGTSTEGTSTRSRVVELRVHGVGGTTPENLLDHPRPDKIAGDDISGFYRRPDRDDLEAYSWGGLTSRSGARAGWLLLLPFALANVAGWLLPYVPKPNPSMPARIQKAVVRLGALLITAVYVLWIAQVSVDLLAYQCGGQEACYGDRWWLTFFENGFFGTPADPHTSRRLVVGMLVPLAFVALLAYLGRTSRNRYEEQFTHEVDDTDAGQDPALVQGLEDGPFWHGSEVVTRLSRLHLGVALAAVAGATADALWRLEREVDSGGWETVFLVVFVAAIAWLVLLTLATGWLSLAHRWAGWLQWGAGGLVVVVVVLALLREGPDIPLPGDPQILPGLGRFSLGATFVLLVLVVVLYVLLRFDRERKALVETADPPAGFNGLGAFAALTMGGLLLAVVLSGTVVRVAGWLGQEADPARGIEFVAVDYTNGYDWLAVLTFVAAVVIGIAVAIRIALLARGPNGWNAPRWAKEVDDEYRAVGRDPRPAGCADVEGEPCPEPDRKGFLKAVAKPRRIRTAIGVADMVVLRIVVAFVAGVVLLFLIRAVRAVTDDADFLGELPELWSSLSWLLPPATWLATLLPLAFLELLRRAYNDPTTRRRVGTVWDVVTFWPRWYHPLSPPSYATRAVPQLRLRLDRLADPNLDEPRPVLLSAHSQGTILAAAVVLRLGSPTKERLALLTHGSPLRRLYGRFFPAHFGKDGMGRVKETLTAGDGVRWRNLYRLTDPIGGAAFREKSFTLGEPAWAITRLLKRLFPSLSARRDREHGGPTEPAIDVLVADPITDHRVAGDPCPEPLGHSGYFSSPMACSCPPYDEALTELRTAIGGPAAAANPPPNPSSG